MSAPNIVRAGLFDLQVCVPKDYTDQQAIDFAESENPCGTTKGWTIRRQDEYTEGELERAQCLKFEDNVHIMLTA